MEEEVSESETPKEYTLLGAVVLWKVVVQIALLHSEAEEASTAVRGRRSSRRERTVQTA